MKPVFAVIEFPAIYGEPYFKILNVINDLWLADPDLNTMYTHYHNQAMCFFTQEEAINHANYLKQKAI